MQECFTRVVEEAKSRMMGYMEKFSGPMQQYLGDTPVDHEQQARLERKREAEGGRGRQRTTMDVKKTSLEKMILDTKVMSVKEGLEARMFFENLSKRRRLRDEVQHEESRESPDLKYLADLKDLKDLKAELCKYSGSIIPQQHMESFRERPSLIYLEAKSRVLVDEVTRFPFSPLSRVNAKDKRAVGRVCPDGCQWS